MMVWVEGWVIRYRTGQDGIGRVVACGYFFFFFRFVIFIKLG